MTAIVCGVHDRRPKLLARLNDASMTSILVEQRDCLTRCGFHYLETLLAAQGRTSDVVTLAANATDVLAQRSGGLVSACIVRRYGPRRAKCTTERMAAELRGEEA